MIKSKSKTNKSEKIKSSKSPVGVRKNETNKTSQRKPKSEAQKYNQDSWDRLTHKGWTDFQYGISKKQKEDKSIFSGYNSGQTTAKLVAMKTGAWNKEMTRSLEMVEKDHLKGKVSKNFYQGYKDVMKRGGIKTNAHKAWEKKKNKDRFVLSR